MCDKCGGMGYLTYNVPITHQLFGRAVLCDRPDCQAAGAIRGARAARLFKTAGIPARLQSLTFDTWLDGLTPAEQADKWAAYFAAECLLEKGKFTLGEACERAGLTAPAVDRVKNSLVLFGPLGCGKTGLAVSMARALAERGSGVVYIRLFDALREIQSRYGGEGLPDEALAEFKTAPYLIIDEALITNVTPDRVDLFEAIIRSRYDNGRPTVLTLNDSPAIESALLTRSVSAGGAAHIQGAQDLMAATWGGRIADPLFDMAHWVAVGGLKLRHTEAAYGDAYATQ